MECSCIKGNFNFQLKSLSTEVLLYQDFSDWMTYDYYIKPEEYKVQVTPPNRSKSIELTISSGLNVITSEDLGMGLSTCLPEGVFSFAVTNCGNTFTRYKAVTPDLECRLQCMIAQGVDPLKVAKLDAQIKSIHYSLEKDLTIEANKIYKTVKREIDLIECDCSCC
jgi:hypothetical protein